MRQRILAIMEKKSFIAKNLDWLIERRKTNPYALSGETGVPQSTIHRILVGESRDPRTDTLKPLAHYFGVSVSDLREVDLSGDSNVSDAPAPKGVVPLISWVQAGVAQDVIDNYQVGDYEELIQTTVTIKQHTYALRVRGDSMEPVFFEGDILIVEPDMSADAGDYVIVRNGEGEATFKKLVQDGSDFYLKALNPLYPMKPLTSDMHICGVVRESVKKFK